MKLSPPPVTVGLDVAAVADTVWDLLVRVDQWPQWGPTVSRASADDGDAGDGAGNADDDDADGRIGPAATGAVWTTVGPSVRFRITDWEDTGPVRHWSWRVAGLPATGHTVRVHDRGCRVEMTAPWWDPGYAPVLWLALRRVRDLAQAAPAGGGTTG